MDASDYQRQFSAYGIGTPDEVSGPRIDKVRKIFARSGAKKILDVGCCNGAILKPLQAGGRELHGVDISQFLVDKANANGIKAVLHDLEKEPLPYTAGAFDAVFCGETIEHQVDTDWLLSEINRVLKPDGFLVLTFPNIRTVLSLTMMAFFDIPPMYAARYRASHVRDFTLKTIRIALSEDGFVIRRAVGSAFYLPKIGEFGKGLATWFPSWANTTVVLAEKQSAASYPPKNLTETIY